MKKLKDLHPQLKEMLGIHSVLENLGFDREHMFTIFSGKEDDVKLFVLLRSNPETKKEPGDDPGDFSVSFGPALTSIEDVEEARLAWNDATWQERDDMFQTTDARESYVSILSSMKLKGIRFPSKELDEKIDWALKTVAQLQEKDLESRIKAAFEAKGSEEQGDSNE